jgi:chromosome segregation ATPase
MVQKFQELIKEVARYSDELHKKNKSVKDEESGTQDVVQLFQSTSASLQKASQIYHQKLAELEKLRNESNASAKEIERADQKTKKAFEDYKSLVDKYNNVRSDFERKMTQSCVHFQDLETNHLRQMKDFLSTYSEIVMNNNALIGQAHSELKEQCEDMTIDKLLEQFVESKKTGSEIPGEFHTKIISDI